MTTEAERRAADSFTDPIDISDEIQRLCGRLGLLAANTRRIEFEPTLVRADVYLVNDNGAKYLRGEGEEAEVAIESLTFKVTT